MFLCGQLFQDSTIDWNKEMRDKSELSHMRWSDRMEPTSVLQEIPTYKKKQVKHRKTAFEHEYHIDKYEKKNDDDTLFIF